jgi:hypothetical protein
MRMGPQEYIRVLIKPKVWRDSSVVVVVYTSPGFNPQYRKNERERERDSLESSLILYSPCVCQLEEKALTRTCPRWHLDLRLSAPRTMRNKFCCF